jgi:protein-S-isoprenylcysteine O-methyltransferase Ste14
MNGLFARAVIASLALPGVVAFLVPLLLAPEARQADLNPWGLITLALGIALLLACVREFYVAGRGTLAPWSPPRALVVTGLYRYSRNPMYVGVVLVLAGWAWTYQSWRLAAYAGIVTVVFHLRVIFHEERWLAATHPAEWAQYRTRVRRWL